MPGTILGTGDAAINKQKKIRNIKTVNTLPS